MLYEEKKEFVELIKFAPLFYILDQREWRIIAVEKEVENGYEGIVIEYKYLHGKLPKAFYFDASPIYIAKSFINESLRRNEPLEFTNDIHYAFEVCIMSIRMKQVV